MIKKKLFILSCARYCAIVIILSLLLLNPCTSGGAARGAGDTPGALSDQILSTPETLSSFLETIYQQSLDRGFTNYYPYSFALIRETYRALAEGRYDAALILSEYAERLSPDLAAASVARGVSLWVRNKLLFYYLIAGQLAAFCSRFYDLEPLARVLSCAALSLSAAFLLTLALFCLTQLAKYLPSAYHDLKHLLPLSMPRKAALGWALLIFCAPPLLGFSLFWALCYWLVLLYCYQCKAEQRSTILLLLLFSLLPRLLTVTAAMLEVPQNQLVSALWNVNYGSWSDRDIARLTSHCAQHPEDTASLFTLGLAAKKQGAYEEAERCFKIILDRSPRYTAARINLGNVYCSIKNADMAIDQYQQALALAPSSASAHYNVSRAYMQKFMFTESEAAFLQAKRLHSAAVDYQLARYSENPNRLLIDVPLARSEIWQKAFSPSPENMLQASRLWDFTCRGVPFAYGWAAPGIFIICALLMSKTKRFARAKRCPTCGRTFCRRCQSISAQTSSCSQCANVLAQKQGQDPDLREAKMLAIKKYRQRQKAITALFTFSFPGAGLLRKGHLIAGLLCSFFFAFFMFSIVASAFLIPCSWDRIVPPGRALPLIAAGLMLFCSAVVVLYTNRLSEPESAPAALAPAANKPHRKARAARR
jgi:tetratricopeptide (TPR) repeat protein